MNQITEKKIEALIEEAFQLDTPEKIETFKRRAQAGNKDPLAVPKDIFNGARNSLAGMGAGAGALASIGGALPMSAVGAANPLGHAALMGTGGALAGAALAGAPVVANAGVQAVKNKLKDNAINKRIVNSIQKKEVK